MDAKRFANPLPGDRKHLTCPRHRARRACAGSAAAHPDRQSEDTVMHSSSRVRSLAVLSPLAFALAAMSAQAATHVNLHEQDAGHMYKQYRAAAARIGAPANVADRHAEMLDRKSTRLNSSHVKISYAVFCLKKKRKRPA